jgi:oxygen-dependent protoporphyrinogen oxidase
MKRRVVIVGAGISGLALGWFLKSSHGDTIDVTILEESDRTGGWVRSAQHEGFLFDMGPRSCRTRGAGIHTLALVEALGMQDETIACGPEAKHRYLYINNRLQKLPSSLLEACFSPIILQFLPTLCREWSIAPHTQEETIASFISRRFDKSFLDTFFDPLTLGIYAGDTHNLSMEACFPEMVQWERNYGGVLKGMLRHKNNTEAAPSAFIKKMRESSIITFKQGMESLTKSLTKHLKGAIHLQCPAKKITYTNPDIVVTTNQGDFIADTLFLAIPPHAIAKVIPEISGDLQSFHAASVGSVHLGWNNKVLTKKGFGYLIPTKEQENLLGVIFDSSAFPQQNKHPKQTRLTAMLGGPTGIDIATCSDDDLKEITVRSLRKHLGILKSPDVLMVSRAHLSIPQYTLGHNTRVKSLKATLAQKFAGRVTVLGSSWHGVALNDCIREAYEVHLLSRNTPPAIESL